MFKAVFILSTLFLSFSLKADVVRWPSCKIQSLTEALECMDKVALALPEYEEPNEGLASKNKESLIRVLKNLGYKGNVLAKVEAADYVGAVLIHGDEHYIHYFIMKKGQQKPAQIAEINLVDLGYDLARPLKVTADDFFLGQDARAFDVFEDIESALKEFENNN